MIRQISAGEAKARVHGDREIAFLDLREAGPFSEGHPLFAAPCPFGLLEARIADLVPRLSTPLLLIDGGDGVAEAGAQALDAMGYDDIGVVRGGAPAWAAAGHTLFKGVNVPSKTLGELVEQRLHPAMVDPATFAAWRSAGRELALVDCRPAPEFAKMTVPGALCVPNGELAHRLTAMDTDAPLVLTCAGRTRSLIGAAGIAMIHPDRRVHALENGTQGWRLAGFELTFDNEPGTMPAMTADAAERTRRKARAFMAARGIRSVDAATVLRLRDDPDRTTYLIDVRSDAEAAEDPLGAFVHALSGQLVQATDQWIATRRARVVLADDLGVRAALAAFWLRALGFDPVVTGVCDDLRALPAVTPPRQIAQPVAGCTAQAALEAVQNGTGRLLDARSSSDFSREHVAGAAWIVRPDVARLSIGPRYIVIGNDGPRAELVDRDLTRLGHRQVSLVEGGHGAMRRAGAAMEGGSAMPLARAVDVTSFAHGRHEGDLAASRLYLEWEMGLLAQLDPEERAEFRL